MIGAHGANYARYRRQVPALVPRPTRTKSLAVPSGLLIFIALLTAAGNSAPGAYLANALDTAALERMHVPTPDGVRNVLLVVPPGTRPKRHVVLLRGAGGSPARLRLLTEAHFDRLAADAGWVVAYPEGAGGTWNDCRRVPDYPAKRLGVNDVAFLEAAIERLRQRFGLSARQVVVAGFSNGGHMALRLAVERPTAIGAVATACAQMPLEADSLCPLPQAPLNLLFFAGTADPVSPYDGGEARDLRQASLGKVKSVPETLSAFVRLAGGRRLRPPAGFPLPRHRHGTCTRAIMRTSRHRSRNAWPSAVVPAGCWGGRRRA